MKVRVHSIWVQDLRDIPEFEIEADSVFEMIKILHQHPITREDWLSPYYTTFRCSWGENRSVSLSFWQSYFVQNMGALHDDHCLWITQIRNYEVGVWAYVREEYGQWRKAFGDESYGHRKQYHLEIGSRRIGETAWTLENSANQNSLPAYLKAARYGAWSKQKEIQEWLDNHSIGEYSKP